MSRGAACHSQCFRCFAILGAPSCILRPSNFAGTTWIASCESLFSIHFTIQKPVTVTEQNSNLAIQEVAFSFAAIWSDLWRKPIYFPKKDTYGYGNQKEPRCDFQEC